MHPIFKSSYLNFIVQIGLRSAKLLTGPSQLASVMMRNISSPENYGSIKIIQICH